MLIFRTATTILTYFRGRCEKVGKRVKGWFRANELRFATIGDSRS